MKAKTAIRFSHITLTIVLVLTIVSIFCILNRGLSVYSFMGLSSYRWAVTGTSFRLPGGSIIKYIDSSQPTRKPVVTTNDYIGYLYELLWENTNQPPLLLSKCKVTDVRNVERDCPVGMSGTYYTRYESIVELQVINVVFDPTGELKEEQKIIAYSFNSEYSNDGNPVLEEGLEYYLTLETIQYSYPIERDEYDEMSAFLRETVDYTVSDLHFAKWPAADGKVYIPEGVLITGNDSYELLGMQRFYSISEDAFLDQIQTRFKPIQDKWSESGVRHWGPDLIYYPGKDS